MRSKDTRHKRSTSEFRLLEFWYREFWYLHRIPKFTFHRYQNSCLFVSLASWNISIANFSISKFIEGIEKKNWIAKFILNWNFRIYSKKYKTKMSWKIWTRQEGPCWNANVTEEAVLNSKRKNRQDYFWARYWRYKCRIFPWHNMQGRKLHLLNYCDLSYLTISMKILIHIILNANYVILHQFK